MLSKNEKLARLKLFRTESIGASVFWQLIKAYGSGEDALKGLQHSRKIQNICDDKKINEEASRMKSIGACFVFLEDELYPPLLRNIPDPPPVMSFLGNKERVASFYQRNIVSVVGARNASIHANSFCSALCKTLGENNVVVASGLARGIDSSAHIGSLETGTIAITACGINIVYPAENRKLYNEIIEKNGIFSEMPFDTAPSSQLFPRRNRIIAGMSYSTVVIEAAEQSGSLITAKMALDYNRDVFAVPGSPLDPRNIGCNNLIKDGAILVQNAQDILDHLKNHFACNNKTVPNNCQRQAEAFNEKTEGRILNFLNFVPVTIDELASYVKASTQEILSVLLQLELSGKIIRLCGQKICLALGNSVKIGMQCTL